MIPVELKGGDIRLRNNENSIKDEGLTAKNKNAKNINIRRNQMQNSFCN